MSTCFFYSVLALVFLVSFLEHHHLCGADPTDGFIPVPLTEDNYKLQKPYDIPLEDRYSYKDGVRRFWVYNKDKPFKPDTTTRPRTEIRISGHDYSSGDTTLQLRMYEPGDMRYYRYNLVASGLYDEWFRVNVIHDVDGGKVTVFNIDGVQKFVVIERSRARRPLFQVWSLCRPV